MVPEIFLISAPWRFAKAIYNANKIKPDALIVMDVLTVSKLIPLNNRSISSMVSTATPTFPTSPLAIASSLSYPICVGKSKATLNPFTPLFNKK